MESATGPTAAPTAAADMWNTSLEGYRSIAAGVLTSHRPDHHECQACHQQWPCQAACAAEFILEL